MLFYSLSIFTTTSVHCNYDFAMGILKQVQELAVIMISKTEARKSLAPCKSISKILLLAYIKIEKAEFVHSHGSFTGQ